MLESPLQLRLKYRASRVTSSPLFNAGLYLLQYPDVREAGTDSELHYVRHDMNEGAGCLRSREPPDRRLATVLHGWVAGAGLPKLSI